MGFAITLGMIIANRYISRFSGYKNVIYNISPMVLLLGVLGARLYFCLLNYSYYSHNLLEILDFRGGGLSIHGAMLGGIIALMIEAKRYKLNFAILTDALAFAMPVSQAMARWGNFFNSEAFGLPTKLPWGVYIPIENRPEKYINFSFFHPTFLYESILDLFIFILLWYFVKKSSLKAGTVTVIYFVLYSLTRILIETIRVDCTAFVAGIPVPIVMSVIIILVCIVYLIKRR